VSEHSPEAARRSAYKLFEDYFSRSSKAEFNRYLDDLIKAGVWYDQPRGRSLISRHDRVRAALTHKDLLNLPRKPQALDSASNKLQSRPAHFAR
jgi:hypothetical protein